MALNRLSSSVLAPALNRSVAAACWRSVACVCVLGTTAMLYACGGGGGGAQEPTTVALRGTVATGAALANATVNIKCKGSASAVALGSATTKSDGSYTTTVTGAQVPCLLQVQIKDGAGVVTGSLYSLASAPGIVNLTSLTTAIVAASLGESDPSATFASLDASAVTRVQTAISQNKPTTAWTSLKKQLTDSGIDTTAIAVTDNPITLAFRADGNYTGTGYDKVLDDAQSNNLNAEYLYRMAAGLLLPPAGATGQLNDTGIDWCSENISIPGTWVNYVLCSTVKWVGNLWGQQQDALSGRDTQAKGGTLQKVGAGMAGFDFTKLGSNGKPLAIQNAAWSDSGSEVAGTVWDCVRDNVTGLMWEVKRNDAGHLRHMDHAYTWFNPDSESNGSSAGTEVSNTCKGVADESKCNTQSYVTAVNAVGLCGQKDWRMPTMYELRNVSHTGRTNPAIDTHYFPNTPINWMWSSTSYAYSGDFAWFVSLSYGLGGYEAKYNARRVRLVRSGQ